MAVGVRKASSQHSPETAALQPHLENYLAPPLEPPPHVRFYAVEGP
jgi:hypothetical protein